MVARGTILVVDEDPANAEAMRAILADEGYRVLVAPSPSVAFDILVAFRMLLVITDAFRPVPATPDAILADLGPLVRAAGAAPLILCSAHQAGDLAALAAHGFAAYLPKPFDRDDLLATVGAVLHGDGQPLPGTGIVARRAGGPVQG